MKVTIYGADEAVYNRVKGLPFTNSITECYAGKTKVYEINMAVDNIVDKAEYGVMIYQPDTFPFIMALNEYIYMEVR